MKFLVDAQLTPGLCVGLKARGHEAVHVTEFMSGEAQDVDIAARAQAEGYIVITKDDDFAQPGLNRDIAVVWLRIGNASNRLLIEWLEPRWAVVEQALADGATFIEVV
jgi:predicted nuclease of predicted toxin-antitoxin system